MNFARAEKFWQVNLSEDSQESAEIPASQSGKHQFISEGNNTGGSYAISWAVSTTTTQEELRSHVPIAEHTAAILKSVKS